MIECRKRQVERRGDEVLYKCINKKADAYGHYVDESVCNACPVRVFIEQKKSRFGKSISRPGASLPVLNGAPSCEFRINGNKCTVTNLPVDKEICTRCAKDSKMETARLVDKLVNYASSIRKWVAAGRPERSDEEVQRLYDEHCSKCNMFDKGRQVCNSCGCPANKEQPAIRNKLRMGTEGCPLGQFGPMEIDDA